MDGTGYGEDGTLCGGEFLEVTVSRYRRLGHLRYISLPGGDMAAMEPWRMGTAYLERIYGDFEGSQIPFIKGLDLERCSQIRVAMRAQINSPPRSSMGRFFDAVSALLGVRETVNYEGQAAVELKQMVEEGEMGLGMIPESGLTLREEFKEMDAALVFDIPYDDHFRIFSNLLRTTRISLLCQLRIIFLLIICQNFDGKLHLHIRTFPHKLKSLSLLYNQI